MAPLFTRTWLADALGRASGESLPHIVNQDGEDLVLTETRFPVPDPDRSREIEARLDALEGLARDEAGQPRWTWLSDAPSTTAAPARGRGAVMLNAHDERGAWILGSVRLDGEALVLETNSAERAERGRTWLAGVLGAMVAPPLTAMQTPEQALVERAAEGDRQPPEPPLPPEEMAALLREVEDRHYRKVLSQPIPALDGKSPRQAARSKVGRRKVADWLKQLENGAARRGRAEGRPPYDFGWMWEALKVTDLRR
jgi:hypothetical protein